MKFRKHNWFDPTTNNALYGIQAFIKGRWANVCEGTKPLLYTEESVRDAKLKELRKKKAC